MCFGLKSGVELVSVFIFSGLQWFLCCFLVVFSGFLFCFFFSEYVCFLFMMCGRSRFLSL